MEIIASLGAAAAGLLAGALWFDAGARPATAARGQRAAAFPGGLGEAPAPLAVVAALLAALLMRLAFAAYGVAHSREGALWGAAAGAAVMAPWAIAAGVAGRRAPPWGEVGAAAAALAAIGAVLGI
jgi:hypothetical protein